MQGIERFKKMAEANSGGVIDGVSAFELWDTFGFPVGECGPVQPPPPPPTLLG